MKIVGYQPFINGFWLLSSDIRISNSGIKVH